MKQDWHKKLIIFLILGIILTGAAVLRFYDLDEESLWLDECFTLDYASKPIALLVETLKGDVHPVGYYLPQHVLINYFGQGEISLRILSVFFGVLSVYLTFVLGRKLFSWKEGLLAAFFMGISYTSILYSQEAKMYSMFAAFFLLSLFYFIKFLEKPSYLNLIFFSVSTTLLLYTHLIGLVILLFYFVFYVTAYLLKEKKIISAILKKQTFSSRFVLAVAVIFALYLPWLKILLLYQFPLLYNFLGSKLIEKLGLDLLPVVVFVTFIISIIYLITLYLVIKDRIDLEKLLRSFKPFFPIFSKEKILFFLILIFLILDFLMSSYFFSSVGIIRFGFFALPLFYIILSKVLLGMRRNYLANILFILLVVSASFELYTYYRIDSKEQFREASEYMKNHASAADVLFLHRSGITKQCFNYYYNGGVEEIRLITPGADDWLLIERASGKENAYLLLSHNFHTKDYFKSRMDSLYQLEDETKLIGITIYKYAVNE